MTNRLSMSAGRRYFPDDMKDKAYYKPVPRGMEIKIKEKLEALAKLAKQKSNT